MPKKRKQKKVQHKKRQTKIVKFIKNYVFLNKWFWLLIFFLVIIFVAYIYYLNYQIQSRFSASRWSLPAKVYANSLILSPGMKYTSAQLEQELKFASYRKDKLASTQGSYSKHANSLLISVREFYLPTGVLQKAQLVRIVFTPTTILSIISKRDSKSLSQFILDPALIAHFGIKSTEDRRLVAQKQLPKSLVNAIIAIEDRSFYSHIGINPIALSGCLLGL